MSSRRRITTFVDWFPFGAAPFIIFALAVIAGGYLLCDPAEEATGDLVMWTFPDNHYQAYVKAAPRFQKQTGTSVHIEWVHSSVIGQRLRAGFWSGKNVPDLCEIEITWAGTFFRGPVEQIGFVDLRPYLERDGLMDKLVRTRLAPYTHRGHIYGVPHDVHPVMLAYRRDLFEAHGIDPAELTTWGKFVEAGRKYTIAEGGERDRYMINLPRNETSAYETLLFQRSYPGRPAGYFNRNGEVIIDNAIAVETLAWYVPLTAGPERIAGSPGMGGQGWIRSVTDGYCLTAICPDWRSKSYERQIPDMGGQMALMPLPAFHDDAAIAGGAPRRTSTWGGTMLGITKDCDNKDLAWEWVKFIYFNKDQADRLFRDTNILAPYTEAWKMDVVDEPRAYWSGQKLGRRYAELAPQAPPQYTSPFVELAKSEISSVIAEAVVEYEGNAEYYRARPEAWRAWCRDRLRDAADVIRNKQQRNPF